MTAGDTYVVQIEASTTASSLLGLLTETSSNFDNVVVTGPNGTGGNPGEEVPPGGNGNNGTMAAKAAATATAAPAASPRPGWKA